MSVDSKLGIVNLSWQCAGYNTMRLAVYWVQYISVDSKLGIVNLNLQYAKYNKSQ